ncbi:MAG TPA: VOC family protein [Candidatus Binataceae bacterium]|nr:VOC family protein [Candidatus Binataceae bacterium]
MAKLRHLALATNDPEKTAEFYKTAFGFQEIRKVTSDLARGYFLSDGTLNIAVLKFAKYDQLGKGLDYVGLHHFGVVVDELGGCINKLESMGAECFMKPADDDRGKGNFEVKFRGPDGVVFDISDRPWPGSEPLPEE